MRQETARSPCWQEGQRRWVQAEGMVRSLARAGNPSQSLFPLKRCPLMYFLKRINNCIGDDLKPQPGSNWICLGGGQVHRGAWELESSRVSLPPPFSGERPAEAWSTCPEVPAGPGLCSDSRVPLSALLQIIVALGFTYLLHQAS